MKEVHVNVHRTAYGLTCGGRLCGGVYGATGKCPCTQVDRLARHAIAVLLSVCDVDEFAAGVNGLEFEEYLSTELTEQLVGCDILEVF